jgi:hypothetical protein
MRGAQLRLAVEQQLHLVLASCPRSDTRADLRVEGLELAFTVGLHSASSCPGSPRVLVLGIGQAVTASVEGIFHRGSTRISSA